MAHRYSINTLISLRKSGHQDDISVSENALVPKNPERLEQSEMKIKGLADDIDDILDGYITAWADDCLPEEHLRDALEISNSILPEYIDYWTDRGTSKLSKIEPQSQIRAFSNTPATYSAASLDDYEPTYLDESGAELGLIQTGFDLTDNDSQGPKTTRRRTSSVSSWKSNDAPEWTRDQLDDAGWNVVEQLNRFAMNASSRRRSISQSDFSPMSPLTTAHCS